jgi:hypothetical protein
LELRCYANEYKRRAYGTHFSREHLAQLFTRNAQLWDSVSNSASCSGTDEPARSQSDLGEYDDNNDDTPCISPAGSNRSDSRHQNNVNQYQPLPLGNNKNTTVTAVKLLERLQPAVTKQQHTKMVRETSIQTSPRSNDDLEQRSTARSTISMDSLEQQSTAKAKNIEMSAKNSGSKQSAAASNRNVKSLIHGVPTRDSHVLIDTTNYDRPLRLNDDADDVLSTARSLSSSCSLASEVLARARQRRDDFWN